MPLRRKTQQDLFDPVLMDRVRANLRLVMASRTGSAVKAHIATLLFLVMIAHIRGEMTGSILWLGVLIGISSLIRLGSSRALLKSTPDKYAWKFFMVGVCGQSIGWALLTIFVMSHFSFTHFYTLMVMLVSASLGAGSTSSLGGDLKVARGFLFGLCGTVIAWLFFQGGAEHNWLGVNISLFLWFNLVQAKQQNDVLTSAEYWKIAAAEAESRLRGVFDAVPSQILVVTDDLMYADANGNATGELFKVDDIRGKKVGQVERSPDLSLTIRETILALRDHKAVAREYQEFSEPDASGALRYWHINSSVADGKSVRQYILTLTDITEVKKTATELDQARERSERLAKSAAVGELASGMAHEVNNPLTILAGHLIMMSKEQSGSSRKIDLMNQQIRRIAGVVHGFLRYAKMDITGINDKIGLRAAVEAGASLVAQEIEHFKCKLFIEDERDQLREFIHEESFTSAVAGLIVQMMSEHSKDATNLYVTFHRRSLRAVGGATKTQTSIRFEMSNESHRDGSWIEAAVGDSSSHGTSYHWIGETIVKDILQRHGATAMRSAQSGQVVEIVFPES